MESKYRFFSDFKSALLFITILPAGKNVPYSPMGMIRFFPVVGLLLGALLVCVDMACSLFWPPSVTAILDVVFLVIVTGAFHIDGLGDTADGIFSHRPRERALEIMKDSRTGMMGLVAVFCVLALKMAGIFSIKTTGSDAHTLLLFLIIPSYSRAAMILGIRFLPYGRKGTGTGLDLFEKKIRSSDFLWMLIPVVCSMFLGYTGVVLNLLFIIMTGLILFFYKKKMNGITGDMLGAMNEILEAVLFLGAGAVLI
jgi:adenosylcobinamide-GDP ribazoletransferase